MKQIIHLAADIGNAMRLFMKREKENKIDGLYISINNLGEYRRDLNKNVIELTKSSKITFLNDLLIFPKKIYWLLKILRSKPKLFFIHFNRTLFDFPYLGLFNLDFRIYQKNFVIYYRGCELRSPSIHMGEDFSPCVSSNIPSCRQCRFMEKKGIKRKRLIKFIKNAKLIFYSTPDLAKSIKYYCPDVDKNKLFHLPVPIDFSILPKNKPMKKSGKFIILHAPSNTARKGTNHIIKAVYELKKEYKNIELVLVENMSVSESNKYFRNCDIFIDQLAVGWYGAAAVKAMFYGKPTICYINDEFIKYSITGKPPVIDATTININDKIRYLIDQKDKYREISKKSALFARRYHDYKHLDKFAIDKYKRYLF